MRAMDDAIQEISALKSATLPSVLYRHLNNMIMSGEILPGHKINELAIAQSLGISRGPVREACRQLLPTGMVTFEPQRGFRVRLYTLDEMVELSVVRAHLAELIGRLVAERITKQQLEELEDIIEKMRRASRARRHNAFYLHSFQFYETVCDVAGNAKLKEFYVDLRCRVRLFRLLAHALAESKSLVDQQQLFDAGLEARVRLLAALKSRDPARCARVMREVNIEGFERNREMFLRATEGDGIKAQRAMLSSGRRRGGRGT